MSEQAKNCSDIMEILETFVSVNIVSQKYLTQVHIIKFMGVITK